MFKKIGLIAMAAATLALPATASAGWKHHGVAIQENKSGTITGNARFQSALGAIECQASASAVFLVGQTRGELKTYGPDPVNETTNCKGLGGLAFCQVHDWTPTGLPWTFHTGKVIETIKEEKVITEIEPANVITITTGTTHAQLTGGFCPMKNSTTTPGLVTITPNQPNTITSGQLSGTLIQHMQTNNGVVDKNVIEVIGSQTLSAPDAHTYDI